MPLTVNVGYSRKLGRPDFGSVGASCHVECERSAKKWRGEPQDYLAIHLWIDQVKSQLGDNRHRAVLHNAWGIHLAVDVFGDFITNSAGKRVFVKEIGEQYVIEDLGFIPSLSDCLAGLKLEAWMAGALSNTVRPALEVATMQRA
jgi:hypothetical protein